MSKSVAGLRQSGHEPLRAEELIARRRNAPLLDLEAMRAELDAIVNPSFKRDDTEPD
ncbi:MAG TPA: hypothetical protein VFT19_13770 [Solirubrobacterales bacterium]|nr:hypothetical protein [Solirubrobacterales bacterium]